MPYASAAISMGVEACRIQEGDAFNLVQDLPDDSVDLILTSPPYWGLRTYGQPQNEKLLEQLTAAGHVPEGGAPPYAVYRDLGGSLGMEPYPDWYVSHLVEWFELARPKLRDSGSLWINLGDTYFARWASIREDGRQGFSTGRSRRRTPSGGYLVDKQLLLIPSRFAIAMQDARWILRNDLIWAKPHPLPGPRRDRLQASHEHWFHFVQRPSRGRASYYYDLDSLNGSRSDVVIANSSASGNGHSATFPPELIRPRIASCCPTGGLVLDPFCGTGTTIRESAALGRRGVGYELSSHYAQLARASLGTEDQ